MNKSQRIWIGSGNTISDNYLKVNLEQDVDTLEIMSLKIDTKDVYQDFNADYGIVVGRVNANGAVGVPNAKVSIFIPLDEEDENNGEITSIYPYKKPTDKNKNVKRYNLLPRVAKADPTTGIVKPKQPFGSFPIKEEILTNPTYLEVYKKYYKYTTVTNDAGDYMIYGVPTGTQTVHMSIDITDIGQYSMTPASMITNLGYSPNLFNDDGTLIKGSNDLDDLPHIETQEVTIDVVPFWGDTENFEIGITQVDFRVRAKITNTFIVFGSLFTDPDQCMWGEDFDGSSRRVRELYRIRDDAHVNLAAINKRPGPVTEKIYYFPANIADSDIDRWDGVGRDGSGYIRLDDTEFSKYKRDGDFVYIIECNRNKKITNEFGELIEVGEDSAFGAYTEFRGFMTFEITPEDIPMNFSQSIGSDLDVKPFRYRLKVPQSANLSQQLSNPERWGHKISNWRAQNFTFEGGKIYSVTRFHGTVFNNNSDDGAFDSNPINCNNDCNGFFGSDVVNWVGGKDLFWNTGVITTNNFGITGNTLAQFPNNVVSGNADIFGANWLHFSLYLMQNGLSSGKRNKINDVRSNTNFTADVKSDFMFNDELTVIAASDLGVKWFARNDIHQTDFFQIDKQDILNIWTLAPNIKGFTKNSLASSGITLVSLTNNPHPPKVAGVSNVPSFGGSPVNGGGRINAVPTNVFDDDIYFWRGAQNADCIQFIVSLGLI